MGRSGHQKHSRLRAASKAVVEVLERRSMLSASTGVQAAAATPPTPLAVAAGPAKQVERLNRGLVAINLGSGNVNLSWRMFGNDPSNISFNIYRSSDGNAPVKINANPVTQTTDYRESNVNTAVSNAYFVRPIINGAEGAASEWYVLPANASTNPYLSIPLQVPAGGRLPGTTDTTEHDYTYTAGDTSVGDVDGDGEYEYIVKWDPSDAKDNSQDGYTGPVYVDAYKLNGTRLWRINLGKNIRAGAHYTQFMVYDFDGDGKAEVAMKTAPGTVDGKGNNVILGNDNPNADYRNSEGYVLAGPEYLTIFNGQTGAAMSTVPYVVPRHPDTNTPTSSQLTSVWGDGYGNRVDRFLGGVAYLDGQRPSLIMARGYYTRATITAWDFRNGQLTQRWLFDSNTAGSQYRGQGDHSLSIADVDNDGKDEIIYGAMAVNDNGTGMYSTGWGHGDALHVSDFLPDRPGQEVFNIHEPRYPNIAASFRDAATGAAIFTLPQSSTSEEGPGRGVAADIWAGNAGPEMWVAGGGVPSGIYDRNGVRVGNQPSSVNFLVWWDADPVRELLNSNRIHKYGPAGDTQLLLANGATSINGTKATPNLSGDVLGDWREEVILRSSDNSELRIYTTTIPANSRMYTLMHDPQYRVAIAWQNTAYNQPPHPSFFIGDGMAAAPAANVYYAGAAQTQPASTYQAEDQPRDAVSTVDTNHTGYNGTGFVNFPLSNGFVQFNNVNGGATNGTVTIGFRYALGAAGSRTGRLVVNGVGQDITFAPTGAWTAWNVHTVNVTLNAGATNTIRLESNGADLANVDELQVLHSGSDVTAPAISAPVFQYQTAPNELKFIFSEDVHPMLQAQDLSVRLNGGTVVNATAVSFDSNTKTATFTLPTALADGNYRATFVPSTVADTSGNMLADGFTFDFFVFVGDVNRDRRIDGADLLIMTNNWLQTGRTYGQGDQNYDGIVDKTDLGILSSKWNQTLSPPVAAEPVSAQPVSSPPPAPTRKTKLPKRGSDLVSVVP